MKPSDGTVELWLGAIGMLGAIAAESIHAHLVATIAIVATSVSWGMAYRGRPR